MSDWDGLAAGIAFAWWLEDRDRARDEGVEEASGPADEDPPGNREWVFRREVALHGAVLAASRWEAYLNEGPPDSGEYSPAPDPDVVRYLCALGFSRRAAIAALRASGLRGRTTEERTVEAILAAPGVSHVQPDLRAGPSGADPA